MPTEEGGQRTLQVGDAVAGFARGALERGTAGDHPDIAYSWYVAWLEWLADTGHTFFGPLVAVGEVVIGICLILGLFTGIMAFLGAILNFSFVFAGSAGVNPAIIVVSGMLILAWRNAGWYGLDRFVPPPPGHSLAPGRAVRLRRGQGLPGDDHLTTPPASPKDPAGVPRGPSDGRPGRGPIGQYRAADRPRRGGPLDPRDGWPRVQSEAMGCSASWGRGARGRGRAWWRGRGAGRLRLGEPVPSPP